MRGKYGYVGKTVMAMGERERKDSMYARLNNNNNNRSIY